MQFHKMPLQDWLLIIPEVLKDHRGVFLEPYHRRGFVEATGLEIEFVQDNESVSNPGVFRCLHFQMGEFAQAKLVQVIHREVLDVTVDLRPESATFQKTHEIILNDQNYHQLNNQQGSAQGILTLSKTSFFVYKCDRFYSTGSESWSIHKDQDMAIDWNFREKDLMLSEKETKLPLLKDLFK